MNTILRLLNALDSERWFNLVTIVLFLACCAGALHAL